MPSTSCSPPCCTRIAPQQTTGNPRAGHCGTPPSASRMFATLNTTCTPCAPTCNHGRCRTWNTTQMLPRPAERRPRREPSWPEDDPAQPPRVRVCLRATARDSSPELQPRLRPSSGAAGCDSGGGVRLWTLYVPGCDCCKRK